jgi:hypothetical protein
MSEIFATSGEEDSGSMPGICKGATTKEEGGGPGAPYPGSATGSVIAEGANKERKDRHDSKFLCKEVDPKNFRSSDKVD